MSQRIHVKKAETWESFEPGSWFRTRGEVMVFVSCGYCGERASLADHTIDAEGRVEPSLVCPAGCGWHHYVQLDGWTP